MIGIDTNVVVRLLARDDEAQFERAARLVDDAPQALFVNPLVLTEAVWVLEGPYGEPPARARGAVLGLLDTPSFLVPAQLAIAEWRDWLASSHRGIFDVTIARTNQASGCTKTLTFDRKAARIEGMELIA